MHEVVVTGYGAVTALGVGTDEFARRMFAGDSGIVDIRGTRVADTFPIRVAGLVAEDGTTVPDAMRDCDPHAMTDATRYAALATQEAIEGLPPGCTVDAIIYATAEGVDFNLFQASLQWAEPSSAHWDLTRSESCLDVLRKVIRHHGNGSVPARSAISIYNACVSSSQAIGMALHRIRRGEWTRAVVGGTDARCNAPTLMDFHLLSALCTDDGPHASRPFSRTRSGFVFGEGAATLVLETREAAEWRGAKILGKLGGYASSSDAYRLTDGRPDAAAATRAIEGALADAGCEPCQVDAVSAHGTSTPLNDRLETKAIKQALGDYAYAIPVAALKSQLGHTTVASAAIQAVASLLMLRHNRVAPTINYDDPDPECDLDYVPNCSRDAQLSKVLSNSFGFGGQNSCLLLEKEGR